MARTFNGSTDRIDYASLGDLGATAQTHMCRWTPGNVPLGVRYFGVANLTGDAAFGVTMYQSGSKVAFWVERATTDLNRSSVSGELVNGVEETLCATWDGGTDAANLHLYVSGVEPTYGTSTSGSGAIKTSDGSFSPGGDTYGDENKLNSEIEEYALTTAVLDAHDHAA